jgi:hypothetical protein
LDRSFIDGFPKSLRRMGGDALPFVYVGGRRVNRSGIADDGA